MNEFQESLEDLMLEKSLSHNKLAIELGISKSTISTYFTNNYYPAIDIAIKMCKLFDCSLDYLFGLSDQRKSIYSVNSTEIMSNFMSNLEHILHSNNISIAKFTRDLKISEFTYYRWKRGMFPKTINLISIAKYFNLSLDYLLGHK